MGRKKIGEKLFIMRLDSSSELALKILSQNAGKSQAAVIRRLIVQAVGQAVAAADPTRPEPTRA
jgi:hypothetical protein